MYKIHQAIEWSSYIILGVGMLWMTVDLLNPWATLFSMGGLGVMHLHQKLKLNTSPKRRTVRNPQRKLTGVVYFRPKFNVN